MKDTWPSELTKLLAHSAGSVGDFPVSYGYTCRIVSFVLFKNWAACVDRASVCCCSGLPLSHVPGNGVLGKLCHLQRLLVLKLLCQGFQVTRVWEEPGSWDVEDASGWLWGLGAGWMEYWAFPGPAGFLDCSWKRGAGPRYSGSVGKVGG